ncbi:MAG: FAD-dependent oxidoreductase [Actinomycetota bacterium]
MKRYDVFVIGGGGTGSEVAFSIARESNMNVGIAERDKFGGECNHYGCVPTKVMLRSAKIAALARDAGRFGVRIPEVGIDFKAIMTRAREIIDSQSGDGPKPFYDAGIDVILDEVRLIGPHSLEVADGTKIEADRIVLTTGSEPTAPPIPGLEGTPYWTNKEAIWKPRDVPASLAVLGTGAIGTEFAQIYARFGSNVTMIENAPHILPLEDAESGASMLPALEAEGIRVMAGAQTKGVTFDGEGWHLEIEGQGAIVAEELLIATGRKPCFDEHDLEAAGVKTDAEDKPVLNESLRTTGEDVWVAGDATGDLLFTHVGTYEAELVVADILGHPRKADYRVVPRVTFSDPEVASVGLTEKQARKDGREVKTAVLKFEDNERATIEGKTFGIVKLIADEETGDLLGGHIVGEEAGAMIHIVVAAMAGRLDTRVAGEAIYAYPTFAESVKGAFLQLG